VASDPGPTERVAARTLVGDAGQRVQGFLAKIGLSRSYLCLNAFAYALHPSSFWEGLDILRDEDQLAWRNELFDSVNGPELRAVIAFGLQAQVAVGLWESKGSLPVFEVPHPSSREPEELLEAWRDAVTELRGIVPTLRASPWRPTMPTRSARKTTRAFPREICPSAFPGGSGTTPGDARLHPATTIASAVLTPMTSTP
jgi:hypothetical protein